MEEVPERHERRVVLVREHDDREERVLAQELRALLEELRVDAARLHRAAHDLDFVVGRGVDEESIDRLPRRFDAANRASIRRITG